MYDYHFSWIHLSTTKWMTLQVQLQLLCTTTVASEMLGSSSSSSEMYHYFHDDTRTTTLVEGRQVNNYRRRVRLLRERVPNDPGDHVAPSTPSLTRTSTGKRVPLPSGPIVPLLLLPSQNDYFHYKHPENIYFPYTASNSNPSDNARFEGITLR